MLEKVTGVIIKTQDYGETNKIVTIFSPKYGKISAIARGAKKTRSRMAAVTQPFIYGEFFIYLRSGLSTIQQGEIIDSLRPIREDIIKTTYVSYITELTDKILESHHPDLYLFDQFFKTLRWIVENEEAEVPMMMYELKVYKKGGFAPIVDRCVYCKSQKDTYAFSIKEGGLLCDACDHLDVHAVNIPSSVAKLFSVCLHVNIEQVGSISVKPENLVLMRRILDAYYDQYGGYHIKSRRVLKQLDLLK